MYTNINMSVSHVCMLVKNSVPMLHVLFIYNRETVYLHVHTYNQTWKEKEKHVPFVPTRCTERSCGGSDGPDVIKKTLSSQQNHILMNIKINGEG